MAKKRGLAKRSLCSRIPNNMLFFILAVVITLGIITIGVVLTSSNIDSLKEKELLAEEGLTSAQAFGKVQLEIIEPSEDLDQGGIGE